MKVAPESSGGDVLGDTGAQKQDGGVAAAGTSSGEEEAPEPDSPEYFKYLTKAIFMVGCNKCITPSILILAGAFFLAVDVSETAQDCLEQMAGGLLIYTWGAKCMVPIQESFQAAFVESKEMRAKGKGLLALVGFSLLGAIILAPLFYLATEGHDFSKVEGGILFFGVMEKGEGVQCNDDGTPKLNLTQACAKPKPTRPGLVHSPQCHGDENSDQGGATGAQALIPYFIGFALDAIMLILVEPEEELVEMYTKMRKSYKSCVKDLLVAPIAFALDNLLTGAGCVTVVLAASGGDKGGAIAYFILFAFMTLIGVCVAYSIRAFMELCNRYGFKALGLWTKTAFLLAAALSFLDNGCDLVKSGLTFWVGIGCAIGWLLFAAELLDSDGGEEGE